LSFLGLGAQPPTPSWGQDINYNQRYLTNLMWWMSVGPGVAIFMAVFAFNFLGDALRESLRGHGYVGVTFDFARPATLDYAETVTVLAGLSRFFHTSWASRW